MKGHATALPMSPASATRLQKAPPAPDALAAQCLKRADGDLARATALMAAEVRADPELYRLLLDGLVETACYERVAKAQRGIRGAIWNAPNHDAGGRGSRVRVLAAGNALMMFPLLGGTLLGEANRAEVEETAEHYRKQGEDMVIKARWLAAIARRLAPNQKVKNALDERRLADLRREAENAN